VLLDWMLPDLDGLSLCRELRRCGTNVPILMLTARGELSEKVLGLESGADDYMVKPFEIVELVARIHALLRRSGGFGRLVIGPLEIDRERRRVSVGGGPCELTAREYELLEHLARRADQVVKRNDLLQRVWETSGDSSSNSVDVHVSRLREKLGPHAWLIETVRGAGYRLQTAPPSP
jgi:DNA-binding response OmpR family regulator